MFKDAREELKRLEEELLQEEDAELAEEEVYEEDEELSAYDPNLMYNGDDVDIDPEELSDEILRPRKKNGLGVALCLLLLAAALLVIAATVLRLRG